MAGDWIKVRTALARDGRLLIASRKCHALGVTDVTQPSQLGHKPVTVLGALVVIWSHADALADENGVLDGYTYEDLDALVFIPGFCDSLPPDWIRKTPEGFVQLPDYDKHNGDSAKNRVLARARKERQRLRDEGHEEVTDESRPPRDSGHKKVTPREEKRRDKTPVVPGGDVDPLLERAKALFVVFRNNPSRPLDETSEKAWKKNRGAVAATSEEEWKLLEWWYRLPDGEGEIAQYRKIELSFLLNKWSGEIEKATRAAKRVGKNFGAKKEGGPKFPDDWKELIATHDPEFPLPATWGELPESVRKWVLELDANRKKEGGQA